MATYSLDEASEALDFWYLDFLSVFGAPLAVKKKYKKREKIVKSSALKIFVLVLFHFDEFFIFFKNT